jgi:hypothetical protein
MIQKYYRWKRVDSEMYQTESHITILARKKVTYIHLLQTSSAAELYMTHFDCSIPEKQEEDDEIGTN